MIKRTYEQDKAISDALRAIREHGTAYDTLDSVEFMNYCKDGWKMDGEFYFPYDEITYTVYYVKGKKEIGPHSGTVSYKNFDKQFVIDLLEPDWEDAQ